MAGRSPNLERTTLLVAAYAFFGALLAFVAASPENWLPGAPISALIYAGVARVVAGYGIRRSAIAIEASETGLDPWLGLLRVGAALLYGTIALLEFTWSALDGRRGDKAVFGLVTLVGVLYLMALLPELAALSLAHREEGRALDGLTGRGRSPGTSTTSRQGHRIGSGPHGAASTRPEPKSRRMASFGRFARLFRKKPLAPSPLDAILGEKDFLP